jgi:hypothetical protein
LGLERKLADRGGICYVEQWLKAGLPIESVLFGISRGPGPRSGQRPMRFRQGDRRGWGVRIRQHARAFHERWRNLRLVRVVYENHPPLLAVSAMVPVGAVPFQVQVRLSSVRKVTYADWSRVRCCSSTANRHDIPVEQSRLLYRLRRHRSNCGRCPTPSTIIRRVRPKEYPANVEVFDRYPSERIDPQHVQRGPFRRDRSYEQAARLAATAPIVWFL